VQSVQRVTTGWTARGSNPVERFSAPVQTGPGTQWIPGIFPGGKAISIERQG